MTDEWSMLQMVWALKLKAYNQPDFVVVYAKREDTVRHMHRLYVRECSRSRAQDYYVEQMKMCDAIDAFERWQDFAGIRGECVYGENNAAK